MSSDAVGKYLLLDGQWYRIISVAGDGLSFVVNGYFPSDGTDVSAETVTMNHLTITGSDITLDRLEISYTPRVQ